MTFDPTKPCETANGRKTQIIHTLRNGDLVVVVTSHDGEENAETYRADGMFFPKKGPCSWDLVNIPAPRWVNVYRDGKEEIFAGPEIFHRKHDALFFGRESKDHEHLEYIACLPFSEGDGL